MKKIAIITLIFVNLLYPAKSNYKVGATLSTTMYGWSYFYTPGVTLSIYNLRIDADSAKVATYYMFDFNLYKDIKAHGGFGLGTFYAMSDTWTLKTPFGVSYGLKSFDIFLDFIPAFSLLSNGQLGSLGFSDSIRGGVRYLF